MLSLLIPFGSGWVEGEMTVEQALRTTNRGMIGFDLLLGTASIAAPRQMLTTFFGHDEPSPDAIHLLRRCGPIPLTAPPPRAGPAPSAAAPGPPPPPRPPPRRGRGGASSATGGRWPGCEGEPDR